MILACSIWPLITFSQWENVGGEALADVRCAIGIGSNIFVGAGKGVFRSSDGGNYWHLLSEGLTTTGVISIAAFNNEILAGTSKGIFRSSNNGSSWSKMTSPFEDQYIYSISVVNNLIYACTDEGLFSSSDGGTFWSSIGKTLPGYRVTSCLEFGEFIIAGTDRGIGRSSDGGKSWIKIGKFGNGVDFLLIDGADLYATSGDEVFHSVDTGLTWTGTTLKDSLRSHVEVRHLLMNNGILYASTHAGVFRSEDRGATWKSSGTGLHSISSIYQMLAFDTSLFVGGEAGMYRSSDSGLSWTPSSTAHIYTYLISMLPFGDLLFVGAESGLMRSSDDGRSWRAASAGMVNRSINALASDGPALLAGTDEGIFRSLDSGETWVPLGGGIENKPIVEIAVSSYLFAGTNTQGIFRSDDHGVSWAPRNQGLSGHAHVIKSILVEGSQIFLATRDGVFKSTNNGDSWERAGNNLTNPDVYSIVRSEGLLFAGTGNIVYVSSNDGADWQPTTLPPVAALSLAAADNYVFAGSDHDGVFLSTNGGSTWSAVGQEDFWMIQRLHIVNETLYAVTGIGLWRRPLTQFGYSQVSPLSKQLSVSAWPNPCSKSTTIRYSVASPGKTEITVFNSLGIPVFNVIEENVVAGEHTFEWDAAAFLPGLYVCRISSGQDHQYLRIIIQ